MAVKNIKAAVVGTGNVGFEVAKQIAMAPQPEEAKYSVGELILFSRDKEKANISRQTLNGLKRKGLNINHARTENLIDFMPDIVINCASEPEAKQYKDRRIMGELNLKLNRQISSQIPADALEIIVTNHILRLSQDISRINRRPELTVGCAHVDSIRAGIAVEERLGDSVRKGDIDKSNIFIIGSHDDNEMVLAYKTATVNDIPLDDLKKISGNFLDIQKYAAVFAHMQVMARQTTSELTAKAVTDTLNAVLTEKDYVSAGILCDFKNKFFRADNDYFEFEKPPSPLYLVMRTGFKDMKAEFTAGEDPEPSISWLSEQAKETKEEFYRIAMKQYEYLKSKSAI